MSHEQEPFSAISEVRRLQEENENILKELWSYRNHQVTKDEAKLLISIQKCKIELKKQKLKKSGYNSHNKYYYFELDDFLSCVEIILDKHGLASFFTFDDDKAYLTICNESGASHTWSTKCIAPSVKENAYDFGVYMKPTQAIQTYARRTLWLQAMEITEPNEIESDAKPQKDSKPQKKQPIKKQKQAITADKLIKPIREPKEEEVTAERIKEILHNAQQRFDEAQEDKDEKERRPFIWDNAKFLIKKLCNNEQEYKACQNSLVFKSADQV